ncbi:MAG: HigA family addiction module antidote protein [Parcubacteria group bacterium]|nr:HigA family addiction module antidote protein [Parcubacteria group bacterium]
MKKNIKNEKQAARVFHPGDILLDELNDRQLTQAEFSDIIGRPARTVNEIIKGKRGITPETAGVIAAALGTSPDMWLAMQAEYDLYVLSKKSKDKPQEVEQRSELYSLFPIADLVRRSYIKRKTKVEELKKDILSLLNLSSIDDFNTRLAGARFRVSNGDIVLGYLNTWVLLAKKKASEQKLDNKYDKEKLKEFAKTIKDYSCKEKGIETVINELKKLGVRVILLPHFSKTRVDGAACWIDDQSPVIVMSLRYQRVDNFFFTLLHEIGHIVLHAPTDTNAFFVDDLNNLEKENKQEKEANDFAIQNLGLNGVVSSLKFIDITPQILLKKSEEVGVHPSLLIGHLQHENLLAYTAYQKFLNKEKINQMIPATLIEK